VVTLVDVRPGSSRARTRTNWLDSRHSFSFGPHYQPENLSFGLLLVHNEDVVAPHSGFDDHAHREMEIVTWVLSGALTHEDSSGGRGVVRPGLVQRMSAGAGVVHSERNEADEPVHFVQMWISPSKTGAPFSYVQADVASRLASGGLVPIASGLPRHRGEAAIDIRQRDAGLSVARLRAGESVDLPAAPYLHVFCARGEVSLAGRTSLAAGDAARLRNAGGDVLSASTDSEVLVWEMHSTPHVG